MGAVDQQHLESHRCPIPDCRAYFWVNIRALSPPWRLIASRQWVSSRKNYWVSTDFNAPNVWALSTQERCDNSTAVQKHLEGPRLAKVALKRTEHLLHCSYQRPSYYVPGNPEVLGKLSVSFSVSGSEKLLWNRKGLPPATPTPTSLTQCSSIF